MRFATPNRSKPRVLAKSPPRPVLREPGHRYGDGVPVKGASMKGRHYIETQSDGSRRRSPISPRSPSPNSRVSRDDITIESSVPGSTKKAFSKPKKNERSPRKDPLPVTRNITPTRISRDGFSVNAEVISVGSESYSRSRARSASSLQSRSHGYGSSDNQSVSGNSVLSTRSTLTKGTSAGATIYAVSTGSLYQSLSQSSPPAHGIHNLQLTQKAFRSVRKACVRDAISQFLESEEDHQNQIHSKQYLKSIARSLSADSYDHQYVKETSLLRKQDRILKMTELLRKSITDELNSYPPKLEQQVQDIFFPSENMYDPVVVSVREEIGNLLLDWKKGYLKETLGSLDKHFTNWETTRQRLEQVHSRYYQQDIPLFQELIDQRQQKQAELLQLKKQAESLGLDIHPLLANFPSHWFEEEELKEEILEDIHGFDPVDYRRYAEGGNGGGELSPERSELFEKMDYEDGLSPAAHRREVEKVVNASVFLSPHLLQVSQPMQKIGILGNEDFYYDQYVAPGGPIEEKKKSFNHPPSGSFPSNSPSAAAAAPPPPPQTEEEFPSHLLAHSSYAPYLSTEGAVVETPPAAATPMAQSNIEPAKTPYQLSGQAEALLGGEVSPLGSNGRKLKINYNAIRVLASPDSSIPLFQISQSRASQPPQQQQQQQQQPPSGRSSQYPTNHTDATSPQKRSTKSQSTPVFFPTTSTAAAAVPPPPTFTPNSLQYSETFFGSPRYTDVSPLTNQFANARLEDETVASSTSPSVPNSDYLSAGTNSQPGEDPVGTRRRSIQSKMKQKYKSNKSPGASKLKETDTTV